MAKGNSNIPTGSDISTGKKIFRAKKNGRMSFNQTFVITTVCTYVYIDSNTSIIYVDEIFYFFLFSKISIRNQISTQYKLYVPIYICYEHDYPKNAKNERKQLGLNSNLFFIQIRQSILDIFGTKNVIQTFFHKLSFYEEF